ncbi:CalY family protein [Prescottella equi]|uniref:CalY family protein n=1 Tax=Rhodococcus hoagii TaxID=43767 RepID=UPI0021B559B3|nr:CalY family protein [Prescottella equi]
MSLRMGKSAWTRTRAVLSLGMVFGLGAVGTLAAWSDSATATTGVFSTSSIQMKVDGQRPTATFAKLKKNSMIPGNSVAGDIRVQNTGTVDYKWAVSASGTGSAALLGKLAVSLHQTAANDGSTCSGPMIGSVQTVSTNPMLVSGRALAAGAEDIVCIKVTVDSSAGVNERFKIADLGFSFTAEGQ